MSAKTNENGVTNEHPFEHPFSWNSKYYRPALWSGGNAYVGYEGQSHNDLCWEFDIGPIALDREGLVFGDGEIVWRGDLINGDWTKFDTSEPEPGVNRAILDALGMSDVDPDFKFGGWNSRMRIQ